MRKVNLIKKGDTLIEVTIAIGIFSMVAIAIVSVMSGGTSNSQNALETTLSREEVDTQAEALRFIHSAYVADMNDDDNGDEVTSDERYVELWDEITEIADKTSALSEEKKEKILGLPGSCSEIYNDEDFRNYAFVINPRMLGYDGKLENTLITADTKVGGKNIMQATSTYPRIVYSSEELGNETQLTSDLPAGSNKLYRAEGLYVVAVKDEKSTKLVGEDTVIGSGAVAKNESAFYDFYIRSCWYGNGDDSPSSVATVVRLYDPQTTSSAPKPKTGILRYYSNSGGRATGSIKSQKVLAGDTVVISDNVDGFRFGARSFKGWNTKPTMDGDTISWNDDGQCLINYATTNNIDDVIKVDGTRCTYTPKENMTLNSSVSLYAMWNVHVKATLTWYTSKVDLDAHAWGTLADGKNFSTYFDDKDGCSKKPEMKDLPVCKYPPAVLDHDSISNSPPQVETIEINTVAGKSLYYFVCNYRLDVTACNDLTPSSKIGKFTEAKVEITTDTGEIKTVEQDGKSEGGPYWNVFAIIDDEIVVCSKLSPNADLGYTEPCESSSGGEVSGGNIVTFNPNGASGTMDNQAFVVGEEITLNPNTYSRRYFEFEGWNTEPDGSGTSYYDGQTISVTDNLVLYALWKPSDFVPISDFNVNDCKRYAGQFVGRDHGLYDSRNMVTYRVQYDPTTSSCWMLDPLAYDPLNSLFVLDDQYGRMINELDYHGYALASNLSTSIEYKYCGSSANSVVGGLSYCVDSYECPGGKIDCNLHGELENDQPSYSICPSGWSIPSTGPGQNVALELSKGKGGNDLFWLSSYRVSSNSSGSVYNYLFYQYRFMFTAPGSGVVKFNTIQRTYGTARAVCVRSN